MQMSPSTSEETAPRLSSAQQDGRWVVALEGSWSAAMMARPAVWSELQRSLTETVSKVGTNGDWDLRSVERLDHTGAQLLWNAWGRTAPAQLLCRRAPGNRHAADPCHSRCCGVGCGVGCGSHRSQRTGCGKRPRFHYRS